MLVNLPGSAIVRLSCTDAVADEGGKYLVFKDTGGWNQGREWRGEEAVRTATQLSSLTESRHLALAHPRAEGRRLLHDLLFFMLDFTFFDSFFIISTKAN